MGLDTIAEGVDRFEEYLTELTSVVGRADRRSPMLDYCLWGSWRQRAAKAFIG
jgi:hypothetical protein